MITIFRAPPQSGPACISAPASSAAELLAAIDRALDAVGQAVLDVICKGP
jgi:hypothetical protein